ncbi:bifunctional [glutamine synthetase] adenylyltransferase/[glutamine synthetase]-adenylyl-L-tyrosine phosphorylase [Maricaulaceae bacterium MS644]
MTGALPTRISTTLPVIDPARARRARERIGGEAYEAWGEGAEFLDAVFAAAPYLARTAARRRQTLERLAHESPEALVEAACAAAREAAGLDEAPAMEALRLAKLDLHLVTALADLSGAFDLRQVTRALSDFADASVQASLAVAARSCGFDLADPLDPIPGLFVLTLGKHGQRSLNYSSDVDLTVFWEPEAARPPEGKDAHRAFARVAQRLAFVMEDLTADGYVFRVDLRLRPDPSSTPAAVNADMARHYFEAVGQNWERAAYAKARWCAGDQSAAEGFLLDLEPFIWRRTLDFEAVEDIHALARQIQAVGRRSRIEIPGHDVKLGRGGIREIEFYAQVLQLVFGGRRPQLRAASTLEALAALAAEGLVPAESAAQMSWAYSELRGVEHRIQMLNDEQTQSLPRTDEARSAVAALTGERVLANFDARLTEIFARVHTLFSDQFQGGESLATREGSLVLTGVEPTPDTVTTLEKLGFSDPQRVWETLAGWAAGRARAARTERARALFSRFAPRLVEGLADTGDPDTALARFTSFFEGLPSGVQPLSLLVNQPRLASNLIDILGLAPRLAEILARRPALLDVMLEPSFSIPLSEDPADREMRRFEGVAHMPFEEALNAARRLAREERLRIGAQLLLGQATASDAGAAFADLADAAVDAMARAAEGELARKHGPAPGAWAVLGMGKLGGRELSADSDLDLIVVYEPSAAQSDSEKPLGAEAWFIRFTQRLVTALSAPTEEGDLYPVDMALRPSGSAGPIAVRLARFAAYYESDEAWTWERMALTRARIIAGTLREPLERAVEAAIAKPVPADEIRADAADMRARLQRDKPAKSPWDLKLREGGLIEIEFIAQTAQLIARTRAAPRTRAALEMLAEAGALKGDLVERLLAAEEDYAALTQLVRAAHGGGFDPGGASAPFAGRLAVAGRAEDLTELAGRLDTHAQAVRAAFETEIGPVQFKSDGIAEPDA